MAKKKAPTKRKTTTTGSSNKTLLKKYLSAKGLRLPHGYETTKRKRK